tara:strand:- start:228 stop:437 length:210 start_codon:yes stop_codon:yes gene_type:complete
MEIKIHDYDLLDVICLCHAGLAQDSPEIPEAYLTKILGLAQGYLPKDQLAHVEQYLAEKKYLPPVELIL